MKIVIRLVIFVVFVFTALVFEALYLDFGSMVAIERLVFYFCIGFLAGHVGEAVTK
jgi:hypothetical protein